VNKLTKIATASALILGLIGAAQAAPLLQIVGAGGGAPDPANQEAIGDPGGSGYPFAGSTGAAAQAGMPTAVGGWPAAAPGFAPDPSFGNNMGISGYDGSYLRLNQAGNVTFQFMGKGNAADTNLFEISVDGGATWLTKWNNQSATNGTCAVGAPFTSGPTDVQCNTPGSSFTQFFNAGLIDFRFVNTTHPATATNDGVHNPKDTAAGYFLGIDPYLAGGAFETIGSVVYAGFTDLPCTGPACDHDYQDLGVRISTVPEPGSILLLGIGFMSLVYGRRKMAQHSV